MASQRPIPQSYYYSGQGRLGIGDRDASTGALKNVVFVGNVTSLTVDIATTKFEHKESMSGKRGIDLTVIQEQNATFSFTSESLTLELLALGLFGKTAAQASGTVAAEVHTAVKKGAAIPLKHSNVSAVVVKTGVSTPWTTTTLVENTDYIVDEGFGTVYILAAGSTFTEGGTVSIAYSHGAYDLVEAFTTGTAPERYLRFEGLNTVDGSLRLIEIPRAAFEPLTGLEFINEEIGSGEFSGNCLPDLFVTDVNKSQYFREKRVKAA